MYIATISHLNPGINSCPQTDERVCKLWNTHSMEYYLALKVMEGLTNAVSREHSTKGSQPQNEIKSFIEPLM